MKTNLTNEQKDYARFLPALSGFYATYVGKQRFDEYVETSRIPTNLKNGVESLNYINQNEGQFQYKWTLYSALSFRGFRSARIKKNSFLNVIAFLFSIYSYIFNIPRLLKLNFFPNKGKQNYT